MDLVFRSGKLETNMKDNGLMIRLMGKESYFFTLVKFMKGLLRTMNHVVTVFIFIMMDPSMLVNGFNQRNMVKGKKFGKMGPNLRASMSKV